MNENVKTLKVQMSGEPITQERGEQTGVPRRRTPPTLLYYYKTIAAKCHEIA